MSHSLIDDLEDMLPGAKTHEILRSDTAKELATARSRGLKKATRFSNQKPPKKVEEQKQ